MIYGIGVDICNVHRIGALYLRYKNKFAQRILAPCEQHEFALLQEKIHSTSMQRISSFLAKRFAAKEALVKAIGDSSGLGWHDAWIQHKPSGAPILCVSATLSKKVPKNAIFQISISDERAHAVAMVVIAGVS